MKEGITLDDFDLDTISYIGEGGFGKVKKITCRSQESFELAVKMMSADSSNQSQIKDLKNEMDVLESISLQNLKPDCFAKYYGYFIEKESEGVIVYNACFQFYPKNVKDFIKKQEEKDEIDYETVLRIFKKLVHGLCFLQKLDICHRDLKAANILLDEDDQDVKIIDFGLRKTRKREIIFSRKSSHLEMQLVLILN